MNFLLIRHQGPQKILGLCALAKKDMVDQESHFILKEVYFIELSLILCVKVVILQLEMELEENRSMEANLQTKTFNYSTLKKVTYLWPMQVQIHKLHNFS